MAASATFVGPGGADAGTSIRATVAALTVITVGDLLFVGEVYRSRIRERTFAGIDVNGAPFAPYANGKAFYFYPNRDSASGRTPAGRAARATAAKNRHAKTGRIGIRTATGIRYESYAAAKAAHGVANVNLFGLEQHPHMLDAIMVRAGGSEVAGSVGLPSFGSEFEAFEQNQPCTSLTLGFYGEEAARARGHNEGTSKLPPRQFFALNAEDLALGEKAIAQRMAIRARGRR
jgi:hypothetical protein